MGLYERWVLPHVVNLACSARPQMRQRERLIPRAAGRVLEIGVGTGLNLPLYDRARVEAVWALDPSEAMLARADRQRAGAPVPVELLRAPAEQIPLEDASVDTVVITYTLCTIPDPARALAEARRVLRPGGELLFCEHGRAPEPTVRRWQERLNPVWGRLGGGCRLDRDAPGLIRAAGFALEEVDAGYLPGWRFASFNTLGLARRPDPARA